MKKIGDKEAQRRALREGVGTALVPQRRHLDAGTTKPGFDRRAYQRVYMRAWRKRKKEGHHD